MVAEIDKNNSENDPRKQKDEKKNKTDLGSDFVPPDGGWGWVVCIAGGISNLCIFPVFQQFGFIFGERLISIGLNNSQITTIFNVCAALSASTGLFNGPMFRRFTFRQIALCAASLVGLALIFVAFSNSFLTYILSFSVLYGIGIGINMSATSLALNTYFKNKRRMATGFAWTVTALGPIVLPYIVTALLPEYDVLGTILILSGVAFHSVASALAYQPVQWHVKGKRSVHSVEGAAEEHLCLYCKISHRKQTAIFSSQFLYNSDDKEITGYEIIDPGTPMLCRANDGWFSTSPDKYNSKLSLVSSKVVPQSAPTHQNELTVPKPSNINLEALKEDTSPCLNNECTNQFDLNKTIPNERRARSQSRQITPDRGNFPRNLSTATISYPEAGFRKRTNTFNREKDPWKGSTKLLDRQYSNYDNVVATTCTCKEERELIEKNKQVIEEDPIVPEINDKVQSVKNYSFYEKVMIFFEFDLLKDLTYVNLMIGLTLSHFVELNFSILTPFVLSEFKFDKPQIALVMSVLAAMDTCVRFLVPFVAEKIGWENKTFYLFGVLGMGLGRIVIAHSRSYEIIMLASVWIGFNKGLRTVFMALVIPSHVPLERLPAASGLQLLFSGIFSFSVGPVVGAIRDATNYTVTLHCLNIGTFVTAISWTLEGLYQKRKQKLKELEMQKAYEYSGASISL